MSATIACPLLTDNTIYGQLPFAQTNLSLSLFACDKAADHTFRIADQPGPTPFVDTSAFSMSSPLAVVPFSFGNICRAFPLDGGSLGVVSMKNSPRWDSAILPGTECALVVLQGRPMTDHDRRGELWNRLDTRPCAFREPVTLRVRRRLRIAS